MRALRLVACNKSATAHVALRSLLNKSWTKDMLQRRYRPFPGKVVKPDSAADLIGHSNIFNLAGYSETAKGQRGSAWVKGQSQHRVS